ncbi:MAG TPA: hemerythrin domain-containing protein [Nitrospira sp.]|nr:hemerythrin domain-containing protein [Nitrospira sp.]
MSEPETISAFFEQDHDRLDALFQSFQVLKRHNFTKATEAFKEFKFGLQRHIVWEEELLFPLWEEKTGMSEGGPTFVMRNEHRQIGEQIEAIHRKVAEQNPDSDHEEQALLNILTSHNLKEERVLYPSIDQVTTEDERKTLFQNMKEIPEERYSMCCGENHT